MASAASLVSADSHVNPPVTMWAEYLPRALRERAPRIEHADGGDFVVFEGARVQQLQLSDLAGVDPKDFKLTGSNGRVGSWNPEARLHDQDVDGVVAEVLYGGVSPLTRSNDAKLRLEGVRAYNNWLGDFCSVAPTRLIGIAELPLTSIEEALAEMARAHRRGHRGVIISAFAPKDSWGDPYWDPLWAEAAERRLPVHFHLGARNYMPTADANFLVNVSMSKLACAEPIATFIFTGILQRNPNLRLVSVEGGVGWLAFFVSYVDHVFHKHRFWTNSPLTEEPSAYYRRQVRATFVDDPVGIRVRDVIGVDNIMWSSDYPHSETTWPNSVKLLKEQMVGVSTTDQTQIVRGNAATLYNIHLPGTS
jgi:predicted TIM-barrel fold metal-dependent hydrolase